MNKIFIIAEIGINHNGSLNIAKKLIKVAKDCGCDAVKFQKRDIGIVYSKDELNGDRESPWGNKFYQQKQGLEFEKKDYDEISEFCKKEKIEWLCSAWDIKSLVFLDNYELRLNKIASPMITNLKFLEEVASRGKHTLISTGMSNYDIIDEALNIFKKRNCSFEIMHCVSVYPCPEEILNLNIIDKLKKRYNCKVGYSGHEPSVVPSIIAATFGISSLERHITLDRSMYGSDQSASLEEPGLRNLINSVRKVDSIIGTSDKTFLPQEVPIAKKLRYWENKR